MIRVIKRENGITVTGHANYDEYGKDIVCASVSTLFLSLIDSIANLTEAECDVEIDSGYGKIEFSKHTEQSKLLVDSFMIGVDIVREEFPEYVSLERECE